jgi:small subunit ribosomal protein S20
MNKGVITLANHKSAEKRNLQNQKRRMRNRSVKTRIKGVVKKIGALGQESDSSKIAEELSAAQSVIDKAAKKGVIHKKTASRKISRLTKQINRSAAS